MLDRWPSLMQIRRTGLDAAKFYEFTSHWPFTEKQRLLIAGWRHRVMSCYRACFFLQTDVKQRSAWSILGEVTITDRGLSHMHGFSEKY